MKIRNLSLALLAVMSVSASAANDVYGTVSELITRSGDNGDNAIYFRLNVIKENSTFESCVVDGNNLVWQLDLTSHVTQYQYDIVQKSYTQQLPVRIIGYDNFCASGDIHSDKIFELSPWSWDYHLANKSQ